jgi:hypothetical protein
LIDVFTPAAAAAEVHMLLFSEEQRAGYAPGAVCKLWGIMAAAAVEQYGCELAVLLDELVRAQVVSDMCCLQHCLVLDPWSCSICCCCWDGGTASMMLIYESFFFQQLAAVANTLWHIVLLLACTLDPFGFNCRQPPACNCVSQVMTPK